MGRGDATTLLLSVSGMVCSACVVAAEEALTRQEGVVEAKVNLLAARAEVRHMACAFWLGLCGWDRTWLALPSCLNGGV